MKGREREQDRDRDRDRQRRSPAWLRLPVPSRAADTAPAPLRQAAHALRLALVAAALRGAACTAYCPPDAAQAGCDSVLLVHSGSADWAADVQAKLRGTGAFATVELFDARIGTPTAAQLAAYHAVLAFSGEGADFHDPAALGDGLAAFHDAGGGVVVAAFANGGLGPGTRLLGAYGNASNGYALLDYALGTSANLSDSDALGDVLEPGSPLMAGVASLSAVQAYRSTAPVVGGRGVVVARWRGGGGEPLVVRGARGSRTLVELNFYPPSDQARSGFWTGDGTALLRNALKYSRCIFCGGPGTFSAAGAVCMRAVLLRVASESVVQKACT